MPLVRALPEIGQRPNEGPSPLYLNELRRGVAPPHIGRQSRSGAAHIRQQGRSTTGTGRQSRSTTANIP